MAAVQGGGRTVLYITLVTALTLVALSLLLAAAQHYSGHSAGERPLEGALGHHTAFTSIAGGLISSFPFWLIVLTPFAVVAIALMALRADRAVDEAEELSGSALRQLQTGSAADQRAAAQALIIAGALLSEPHDHEARQSMARMLRLAYDGPTGAISTRFPPSVPLDGGLD
ncbi:hypothetical protein ACH47X_07980 [Promicromonospora kroppenstedtii]|uniref:Uncharacterized protein n=1 Tax=Promicromonospora kroppenstedtii TaxID=440482 RepID=A0ABW7XH41_9MICO